ncbi:oligopeptidase B [Veronia pacifica]|uniref:Oligopeptidase B n=1 Tax=Veronia pacifica TaxID=1080227 RepID=A0A1C3EKQ5_9GAMM|nr:oligopeptidase B [Veronia pacifica]
MPSAPVAKKVPYEMTHHDHKRVDNYYWMRDDSRSDKEILAHLEAENAFTDTMLSHTEAEQNVLFEELKGRIVKDDSSVPVKKGNFFYTTEVSGDNEYPVYVRADNFDGENKLTLLDVNQLASEHEYYHLSGTSISPDANLLAYGEDTLSRRIYTLRIKDLTTDQLLKDELAGTSGQVVWQNDNKAFYYIKKDEQTLLEYQVYKHELGTDQSEDVLIYEETDLSFYTFLSKSKDDTEVYIWHYSTDCKAVSVLSADDANAVPELFYPREHGLEYSIEKHGDSYFVLTNHKATNFRLMTTNAAEKYDIDLWQDAVEPETDALLEDFELFENHLVYQKRKDGITSITVREITSGSEYQLPFEEQAFTAGMSGNIEMDAPAVRIYYSSLTTPASSYDFELTTGHSTLLKQQKVLGEFSPDNYQSERIMVTARDGKRVPVSLVYRKDSFKQDGTNPLYQYGYGSYGATIDPSFSRNWLSLLDRGFVCAIAHIRGSEMLGRPWYEDGKLLNKMNTFTDFIDVTMSLVEQKYCADDKVFAVGGSAGGLLMGAVVNMAPELYRGIASHVPFVDVVTTMLDESIPLTTNEYGEWGNPNEKVYYDYMLSYSPYDNITPQAYPHILVTTGLHDSQVQYFEPMKWVAKLRELKTDNNKLLFKTDMEAGHGGASGRFKALHDKALEYAFFFDLLK